MGSEEDVVTKKKGNAADNSFGTFIWNSQKKEFLGRNCCSWTRIGIFYVIFYACLTAFFAACMAGFFSTIDELRPSRHGIESILRGSPGMGFRPLIDSQSTLIKFQANVSATYQVHVDHISAFLQEYEKAPNYTNVENCANNSKPDPKKSCTFDIGLLGDECIKNRTYGYHDGRPCVLLKLNRIYSWEPTTYSVNGTNIPEIIRDDLEDDKVFVTCEGENPADVDNIGEVKIWPSGGFPSNYFPFLNQPDYKVPLVMVQFPSIVKGVIVQVWCKAWAENIFHHKNDKAGSVHFELFVD